jgi:hypothetical protein
MMRKLLFIPFSVVGGLIAGLLSKKFVDMTWGLVDDEEPPEPGDREVSLGKLALALTIQGAIFALVRGLVERGSRRAYHRFTGTWPEDEEPEQTR